MSETKNIQYFLEEEKEFCTVYPDYGEFFFDEKSFEVTKVETTEGTSYRKNYLSEVSDG